MDYFLTLVSFRKYVFVFFVLVLAFNILTPDWSICLLSIRIHGFLPQSNIFLNLWKYWPCLRETCKMLEQESQLSASPKDPEVSEQYQILLNLWTVCNFTCGVISELTGCLSSVSNNTDTVIFLNKLVSLNVNSTLRAGSVRRHRDIIQVFMLDVMRQCLRNK